ncbi:unnamed protein product [Urochloa humidicola]
MAPLSFLLAASIPLARPSPTPSARRTESGAPDLPARLHRPAAAPPTPPAAAPAAPAPGAARQQRPPPSATGQQLAAHPAPQKKTNPTLTS